MITLGISNGMIAIRMSRSYKKTPAWSWVCYFSNKKDRRIVNRLLRHKNKQIIKYWKNQDSEKELCNADFKLMREVSDVWDFASDGLAVYRGEPDWRESEEFENDTEESFMEKVRNMDEKSRAIYLAKWYYYKWKQK